MSKPRSTAVGGGEPSAVQNGLGPVSGEGALDDATAKQSGDQRGALAQTLVEGLAQVRGESGPGGDRSSMLQAGAVACGSSLGDATLVRARGGRVARRSGVKTGAVCGA